VIFISLIAIQGKRNRPQA